MAKKHLSPALFLAISMGLVSAVGMVGCSHSAGTSDSDVPPADAGTDAVPQAAVDGANPVDPNDPNAVPQTAAAPGADGAPAATADAGAPPPPPSDTASAVPPAPDAPPPVPPVDTASAAPAAPAAPVAPTDTAAATPPPAPATPAAAAEPAPSVATNSNNNSSSGVGPQDYTVQSGDTLMKIAFQTYGDLYKWHDIYQANQDRIKNPNDVPPGTVLKIDQPSVPVSIERNGDQYLIKVGDTLGTISTDVYGTKRKWKKLYENNRQLIKDPNKIYAGFYLFYTLTPEERQQLEQRGGPGQSKPLADNADGGSAQPQAAADPAQPDANAPQAAAPQAAPAQAGQPQAAAAPQDARMPASVPPAPAQQVAKAPAQPGAPSDDLNQVAQQPH